MLKDAQGRIVDYLRLAVTDRCNLRCLYCMPTEGIEFLSRSDLLSYEELERLTRIFVALGIRKVRITGGEPFVRRNMIGFLRRLSIIDGIENLHLTTNGVLTGPHLSDLKNIGIAGINLSLDTLDEARFLQLTRRSSLDEVLKTLHGVLDYGMRLKINMVVMGGLNHDDIVPMANLAENMPIQVRFIEEMPFNGTGKQAGREVWTAQSIMTALKDHYSRLSVSPMSAGQTAQELKIPGFRGSLGIIAAYSRTFCGHCNRARVTPEGRLKTCLYDGKGLDLRSLLRGSATDDDISAAIRLAFQNKAYNGFEAERLSRIGLPIFQSMAQIGG